MIRKRDRKISTPHDDKHVWFVNHHALIPSKDGGAGRHLNMARYLPEHGWTASLIVASTVHARGAQAMDGFRLRKISEESGVSVLWVRATAYGNSTARRFIGMFVFAVMALMPRMTSGLRRPDVIVGSTVHLLGAWVGSRLAKRYRVPFVYEIRDVWPDALVHLGRLKPESLLARGMERLSVRLAREASLVVSPLPRIDRYLKLHDIDQGKFLWVSNGFDGERESRVPDYTERDEFTYMYLGAHGNANALDGIMEAFDEVTRTRPDVDFRLRLVGSGPLKSGLIAQAQTLPSAARISFEDRIPQDAVIERAREADCLVANLHDSPVYDYGISPNKLFTYLFAYRPVVFACSAPNNPIADAGSGIVVPGDDRPAMARAMLDVYEMPAGDRMKLARRGYDYVLQHYSHRVLTGSLANGLDHLRERAAGGKNSAESRS